MQQLSAIKRIEQLAHATASVISLAQGMPGLPSDTAIRKAAIDAIAKGDADHYSFSAGLPELRKALRTFLLRDKLDYALDEILVTAGVTESLSAITLSLLSPGDEVITFTPTYYSDYKTAVTIARGIVKPVPLIEKDNWCIDFKKLEKTISKKTKLIIVCNPNNPTGTVFPKKDIVKLGNLALKHNIIIVLDDVYHDLYYDEKPYVLCSDPRFRNTVVRIFGFSKIFSLCGWRIAFIHGPENLIEKIIPVHGALVNCAPVVSQYAALGGLKKYDKIAHHAQMFYKKQRDFVVKELKKLSSEFSFAVPDGAYYIFPKLLTNNDDEAFCIDVLQKAHVAIVPGYDFGLGGEGHARICYGRSTKELKEGMKRLSKYFLLTSAI